MEPRNEFEWNEEELEALAALEREVEPDRRLEELTVARLRDEGLIRSPASPFPRTSLWGRMFPAPSPARLGWASAAAAVAVALFFAGVAVGQRSAVRSTADALAAFQEDALMQASARVQQTGSAYVAALTALGQLAATAEPLDVAQGREAALAALYAASSQLVRLDPDDPVASRILQGLEDSRQAKSEPGEDKREVMWF